MTDETILTNAFLVLSGEVIHGTLVIRDGRIAEVQHGRSHVLTARDLDGDHLIPGVVDVHTDNLERQVQPRQNARWPSRSAMIAHDAQCAAAGVTTVFDALCLGDLGFDQGRGQTFLDGVADLDALTAAGVMRAEHFLHLRCELPAADMVPALDPVADHPLVRMVSLMDHSPGVGQYRDIPRYVTMRRKQTSMTVEQVESRIEELLAQRERLREPQRAWLLGRIRHRDLPVASHDDDSPEEVRRNLADGIAISEFPVAMEAAEAARDAGVAVIAGAPNIVRGGSHSGNVSAADLVRAGAADAFASDYVPASMIEAAWRTVEQTGITLPAAVAMIADAPARMARLPDRGRLEAGLRADLVQVRPVQDIPVVRRVWREGQPRRMTPYRVALYWAPEDDDPLHARGSTWLGRDAASGEALAQPAVDGIDLAQATADPRGYGLHATLKPPFRLAQGYAAARDATAALAARTAPFDLPPLSVHDLDGFLALREDAPCPALNAFADACVTALDDHRTPPDAAELARRRPERLPDAQRDHLTRWGYPYVFEEWRFHVTLTRRLTPKEKAVLVPAVTAFLGDAPGRARRVAAVSLFVQPAPGTPFTIAERLPLRG